MLIENIGWFLLGAALSNLIWGGVFLVPVMRRKQREKKFASFVERIRASVPDAEAATSALKEIHFRDRDGALCKVDMLGLRDMISKI